MGGGVGEVFGAGVGGGGWAGSGEPCDFGWEQAEPGDGTRGGPFPPRHDRRAPGGHPEKGTEPVGLRSCRVGGSWPDRSGAPVPPTFPLPWRDPVLCHGPSHSPSGIRYLASDLPSPRPGPVPCACGEAVLFVLRSLRGGSAAPGNGPRSSCGGKSSGDFPPHRGNVRGSPLPRPPGNRAFLPGFPRPPCCEACCEASGEGYHAGPAGNGRPRLPSARRPRRSHRRACGRAGGVRGGGGWH